jgi:hypothetical protein
MKVRFLHAALCAASSADRTAAFYAVKGGSNPSRRTARWSIGRMPGSQPGDGGFDSRTRYYRVQVAEKSAAVALLSPAHGPIG